MIPCDMPAARLVNGVTLLGPDLFERDERGQPLSPIATAFPRYGALVTGRGIHAMQVEIFLTYLREKRFQEGQGDLSREEEHAIFEDAVSLVVRNGTVVIRSDPQRMDHVFEADALLRRLVPKERIQFTGAHLPEVRRSLRRRGESWRITPTPRDVDEMCRFIEASKVTVGTNTVYYHNAPTGGRFLTYQVFMEIRPLLRDNPQEALARLNEVLDLTELVNDRGAWELSFFVAPPQRLATAPLAAAVEALRNADGNLEAAERNFDRFARAFAEAAGAELCVDDPSCGPWRKTMYCRLTDITQEAVEEWALGLSEEFFLNVRWLPGARITPEGVVCEPNAEARIRKLARYYWETWEGLVSINLGRIASPQATRERTGGEQREVYLVVLGLGDDKEELRIVRMIKWDVMHRLDRGLPLSQAVNETLLYKRYIFDRLAATELLGIPVPQYETIELQEDREGIGRIPVIFFDRPYFPGIATDKIPPSYYRRPEFVVRLAGLLGEAAAVSVVLGRASPQTGHVFFDDGDEVVQLSEDGLPEKILLADTTGSFTDWVSPLEKLLEHCLEHVATHLARARVQQLPAPALNEAVSRFGAGFTGELRRLKDHLSSGGGDRILRHFAGRSAERGGIRNRVESVVRRLEASDVDHLLHLIETSPALAAFRAA